MLHLIVLLKSFLRTGHRFSLKVLANVTTYGEDLRTLSCSVTEYRTREDRESFSTCTEQYSHKLFLMPIEGASRGNSSTPSISVECQCYPRVDAK